MEFEQLKCVISVNIADFALFSPFQAFLAKKAHFSHFYWSEGYRRYETLIEMCLFRLNWGVNDLPTASHSRDTIFWWFQATHFGSMTCCIYKWPGSRVVIDSLEGSWIFSIYYSYLATIKVVSAVIRWKRSRCPHPSITVIYCYFQIFCNILLLEIWPNFGDLDLFFNFKPPILRWVL